MKHYLLELYGIPLDAWEAKFLEKMGAASISGSVATGRNPPPVDEEPGIADTIKRVSVVKSILKPGA